MSLAAVLAGALSFSFLAQAEALPELPYCDEEPENPLEGPLGQVEVPLHPDLPAKNDHTPAPEFCIDRTTGGGKLKAKKTGDDLDP